LIEVLCDVGGATGSSEDLQDGGLESSFIECFRVSAHRESVRQNPVMARRYAMK
jgi:hypothetical protein